MQFIFLSEQTEDNKMLKKNKNRLDAFNVRTAFVEKRNFYTFRR